MKKLLLVPVLLLFAASPSAQDIDAMARWTSYKIVHYKMVGEFSGETVLMKGSGRSAIDHVTARVTDRVEVEFDWDQQEFDLAGKPVIRNFPTKVVSMNLVFESSHLGKVYRSTCPEPKPSGPFELLTGVSVKTDDMRMSGFVNFEVRRDQPGGTFASVFPADDARASEKDAKCGDFWETAKPVSETSTMSLMAVPGMFLAMPITDPSGMKISADKKSIILPPGKQGATNHGWTWTVTPTGVK